MTYIINVVYTVCVECKHITPSQQRIDVSTLVTWTNCCCEICGKGTLRLYCLVLEIVENVCVTCLQNYAVRLISFCVLFRRETDYG